MTAASPAIVWFRQDLRLDDNPAYAAAAASGAPVLPLYVLDDTHAGEWRMGGASRWWLRRSLEALDRDLDGALCLLSGPADRVLPELVAASGACGVFWNRCYEPWRMARDRRIRATLDAAGCAVRSYNGSLLFEPTAIRKADGTPYRVYTPFYRNGCLANGPAPRVPCSRPRGVRHRPSRAGGSLDDLGLLPRTRWYEEMAATWTPGERGAAARLRAFLAHGLAGYRDNRNRPDLDGVSRLSPHLHFGELSPHRVWHAVSERDAGARSPDAAHYLAELGWREFSYYLLYHWPQLTRDNLQRRFNRLPWRDDPGALGAWQQGRTGYPIVDAGMRELWRTGYMHNRVRMVAGSFLVKNLLLHWHHGADWFWDTLVDADLANNSVGWQWVAGTGADAAPYFRIFNPVTQGRKFDPTGNYVRRYVPELAALPDRYLHEPWAAPAAVLKKASVTLGNDYPYPIVEMKASRERALAAFSSLTPD